MRSKERKRKELEQLQKVPGKEKYILQSYQGGYKNIKLFLILILAVDKTNSPWHTSIKNSAKFF